MNRLLESHLVAEPEIRALTGREVVDHKRVRCGKTKPRYVGKQR